MNTKVLASPSPGLHSPRFSYCAFSRRIDSPVPLALPRPPLFSGGEPPLTIKETNTAIDWPLSHALGSVRYGCQDQRMGIVVPRVGDFLFEGRNQLSVQRVRGASDSVVSAALSALVLVFGLRQDPVLVFRGSTVGWRGGACLFLGPAWEESSLVEAMSLQGGAILSTGLTAVAPGPEVWPGLQPGLPPRVFDHLWSGSVEEDFWDGHPFEVTDGRSGLYSMPLRSVFILEKGQSHRVEVEPLTNQARWDALASHLQGLEGLDDPQAQRGWLERWLVTPSVWLVRQPGDGPLTKVLEEVLFLAGKKSG